MSRDVRSVPSRTCLRRCAIALLLACSLLACGSPSLIVIDSEVDGPGTLGLSTAGLPVSGLIVYFHGMDQDAAVIRQSEKHKSLFKPLLDAGYAVISADAGGNAFGNPASRDDYRKLLAAARKKYNVQRTFFVAESMGALPALALLRDDGGHRVKGMIGITPLSGLPPETRSVGFIEYAWNGAPPADAADPMTWPPDTFVGRRFLFYVSPADDVIPPGATGTDFAKRFSPAADIEVTDCQGGHVAESCYDGPGVRRWIKSLG